MFAITADMIDEGTGSLSALDVSEALARIGAEYDVDVGADAVVFSLTTLERLAETGIALLSDMVTRPSLKQNDFDRVRQLRLDRLKQLKDLPPAVAERAFLRLLYGDHPYGHLALGTERALRSATLDDVTRFHATLFSPDRSALVIAGSGTHDELRRLAERGFGGWSNYTREVRSEGTVQVEPNGAVPARLAVVPREGAAQSELRMGHLAARRNTPDYSALIVMNAVL